jgi:Ssp1 endopeptidase immunity protein Rap1a
MKYLILTAALLIAAPAYAADEDIPTAKNLYVSCTYKAPPKPADPPKWDPKQWGKMLDSASSWAMWHKAVAERSSCHWYLLGIADGYTAASFLHEKRDCVPNGVTANDLRDIVVKFYDNHPEKRHLKAMQFVTFAFIDAFNCKSGDAQTSGGRAS